MAPGTAPGADGAFAARLRAPGSFTVGLALRTHYGGEPSAPEALRRRVAGCLAEGLVQGFFVSDGGRGPAGLPTETIAGWVLECGGAPVLSLSLAVQDRDAALERVGAWSALGVRDLLVVTGDYPGPGSRDSAVFDIDSVQALMTLRDAGGRRGGIPAGLNKGCVVSPFKRLEPEVMWQYLRLRRKVEAGADFIVAQAGFDARAWDELIRLCRRERLARPVIGTVLVPDAALARRIGAGEVPGVSIPPRLLARLAAPDAAGLRLAGAAVAILRGLGYQGALLGGRPLATDEVRVILEEAQRLAPRWEECLGEFREPPARFWYFREDEKTGLNEDRLAEVPARGWHRPMYGFSYAIDHVLFSPVQPVFRLLTRTCRFCDTRPVWRRALLWLEWLAKAPLYRCRMCGDCTLYACGFFCSESGCPKRLVNGPCGGSRDGACEVPGAGTCLWVKVYARLKSRVERPGFTTGTIPPKNRQLEGTSSWINFCLGRDHRRQEADHS